MQYIIDFRRHQYHEYQEEYNKLEAGIRFIQYELQQRTDKIREIRLYTDKISKYYKDQSVKIDMKYNHVLEMKSRAVIKWDNMSLALTTL